MTPRNSARPTRAMRACVAFFVVILALMSGDRPRDKLPRSRTRRFRRHGRLHHVRSRNGRYWPQRDRLHDRIVVQAGRDRNNHQHGRALTSVVPLVAKGSRRVGREQRRYQLLPGYQHLCHRTEIANTLVADFEEAAGQPPWPGPIARSHLRPSSRPISGITRRRPTTARQVYSLSISMAVRLDHHRPGRRSSAPRRQHPARVDRQCAHLDRRRRRIFQRGHRRSPHLERRAHAGSDADEHEPGS